MYAVLSKRNQTSWDVIKTIEPYADLEKNLLVETAVLKTPHPYGMETTSFKNDVKIGSIWNGISFSDGTDNPELIKPLDFFENKKRFSFISENVVIANFLLNVSSRLSDFMSEKFNGEVILVKVPEDQSVTIGETLGWNGSRFTEI
jgi:hypothetical protein